ncbi:MAG TPA: hypothetical protein VGD01_11895 [Candidatus Elarobacter sp.]
MRLAAIWEFIAGDSRLAPVAVAIAVILALVLLRSGAPSAVVGPSFAAVVACGLAAAVFERR